MQITEITETEWRLTVAVETVDDDGAVHSKDVLHRVFMPAGATEADVVSAFDEATNPTTPTPEQIAARQAVARAQAVKATCKRRIYAVTSAEAQMNIMGARTAGNFDAAQQDAYVAWVQWIADMRAGCAALITDAEADYTADTNWPACPPEVAALAAEF